MTGYTNPAAAAAAAAAAANTTAMTSYQVVIPG